MAEHCLPADHLRVRSKDSLCLLVNEPGRSCSELPIVAAAKRHIRSWGPWSR